MPASGGYDDYCKTLMEETQARCAIVIVLGGERGSGFAVTAEADIVAHLPSLLEDMAQKIRGNAN